MALIKCNECGKEISDKAKKCPHCGIKCKNENDVKVFPTSVMFILIVIFVAVIFLMMNYNKKDYNNSTSGIKENTNEIIGNEIKTKNGYRNFKLPPGIEQIEIPKKETNNNKSNPPIKKRPINKKKKIVSKKKVIKKKSVSKNKRIINKNKTKTRKKVCKRKK